MRNNKSASIKSSPTEIKKAPAPLSQFGSYCGLSPLQTSKNDCTILSIHYQRKKSDPPKEDLIHSLYARRFERPTPRLGGECSIQLSYAYIYQNLGINLVMNRSLHPDSTFKSSAGKRLSIEIILIDTQIKHQIIT